MLAAERPQGSHRKEQSPHFIDEKLSGALTHLYTPTNSEAHILTSQTPLLGGFHSSYNGVLVTARADANRARELQSTRLWGIIGTHWPPRSR